MTLKAFRAVSSDVQDVNQLSRNVDEFTRPLVQNPLLDGQLLENISISGALLVNHDLGRPWRGYLITNKNASVDIYATRKTTDNLMILLTASGPATVDIWIF